MAYNANIPNATDVPNASQSQIKTNFQALESWGNGYGDLTVQTNPTFAAGHNGIYNKNNTATSKNEVYLHTQHNSGAVDIPITSSILSTATPTGETDGWAYFPGGLILKWVATSVNGQGNVVFPTGPGTFSYILTAWATPYSTSTSDVDVAIRLITPFGSSTNTIQAYGSKRTSTGAASVSAKFFALGYI